MEAASIDSVIARAQPRAPWLTLLAASFAFRAPALLNAGQTNSDAAIVGLQALHILRGEWSPFLWGSGYQTSCDAMIAALFFSVLGAIPFALMLSALCLHVLLTWLVFDVLRRRTTPWQAVLLAAPLVFTSSPSHTYILYPPRQAALTLAIAALWAFDRAADARRHVDLRFALSGALAGLACFADPYALVAMPPIALFALACAWWRSNVLQGERRERARAIGASAGGAIVGLVPLFLLWASPRATHGQVGLTAEVIAKNARLLVEACLPWALGTKVYFARHVMDYAPWDAPLVVRAVQIAGAVAFAVLVACGGLFAFARRVPWDVRRLGLAGSFALPVTIAGFLTSVMVMDIFSARYLACLLLFLPFALAPVAVRLGTRRFAILLAPYLAASAIAGWVGFGSYVAGIVPQRVDRGVTGEIDEERLVTALSDRGVRYALADYWTSYRLTFLAREVVVVVPTNASEDRYPAYRAELEHAETVAYIYDPARSREEPGSFARRVAEGATPFRPTFERLDIGALTVLILHRSP